MPGPHHSPAPAATESLDPAGCREVLARNRLCTLSMLDDTAPYAVPLFYGFDGNALYLGLAEGRKTGALDRNPRVCITVVETGSGDTWTSVQVTGDAEFLRDEARDAGVQVLMDHNRRIRSLTAAPGSDSADRSLPPAHRRHGGRIVRICNQVMTGRARR